VRFEETTMPQVYLIHLEKREDERGFFAREWCKKEFAAKGITSDVVQVNISYSKNAGTMRGLHYQIEPHGEAKLVRCIRGSIFDVIIDLRPGSPTYNRWHSFTLTDDLTGLYVPDGFAHGFLTLEDDTLVTYLTSNYYSPESERGIRWDDPVFNIAWPKEITVISAKDKSWPDYPKHGSVNHQ